MKHEASVRGGSIHHVRSSSIHHVRCVLADINQSISITKLHFICATPVAIKTNITEEELQK